MCAPLVPPKPSKSEAGFSLLEALISLAILSLALGTVFSSSTMGLRGTARAADRSNAALQARSLIDRLGVDIPLSEGTYDGTTETGQHYRLVITPASTRDKEALDAFAVEASIDARTPGAKPLVTLRTLRTAKAGS